MRAVRATNAMNYHPIMAEAEALGVADVTAFLREEPPRRWIADYKEATPRATNIVRIELGTFVYLFDFVTELEFERVLEPGTLREDRLVAGHGFSTAEGAVVKLAGCAAGSARPRRISARAGIRAMCSAGHSADALTA